MGAEHAPRPSIAPTRKKGHKIVCLMVGIVPYFSYRCEIFFRINTIAIARLLAFENLICCNLEELYPSSVPLSWTRPIVSEGLKVDKISGDPILHYCRIPGIIFEKINQAKVLVSREAVPHHGNMKVFDTSCLGISVEVPAAGLSAYPSFLWQLGAVRGFCYS